MKTLSIRQPWAWLIVNGYKDIENRTWKTKQRGTVLIHAGKKKMSKKEWEEFQYYIAHPPYFKQYNSLPLVKLPEQKDIEFGGIVGQANIIDCVNKSDSPWFEGPFGFVLENQKPLPYFHVKGQLNFFNVDYPFKESQ